MTEQKPTLGRAIDQIIEALQPFEPKERATILGTVCDHLQITGLTGPGARSLPPAVAASHPAVPNPSGAARSPILSAMDEHITDIRSLRKQKEPNSARQMACLVGYYLQELAPLEDRKTTMTTVDVEKYFKQANYELPKKLEQLLIDCKRSGYVDSTSRGEYRLTRVGYNLVTHGMPSKQSSK